MNITKEKLNAYMIGTATEPVLFVGVAVLHGTGHSPRDSVSSCFNSSNEFPKHKGNTLYYAFFCALPQNKQQQQASLPNQKVNKVKLNLQHSKTKEVTFTQNN